MKININHESTKGSKKIRHEANLITFSTQINQSINESINESINQLATVQQLRHFYALVKSAACAHAKYKPDCSSQSITSVMKPP